jgi:glycerol-1-phosphate dehydrogenase [NAD(P)+]
MKSALNGTPHDLHGAQVGVATVHCLKLWERVIAVDPDGVDVDACVAAQPADAEVRARIKAMWSELVAGEVLDQWAEKSRDRDEIAAELRKFKLEHAQLADSVAQDVLPAHSVEAAIVAAGGPTQPEELDVPFEDYTAALSNARFIRNRFTILDLAAELCICR